MTELDPDDAAFETLLSQLPHAQSDIQHYWDEDTFEPVTLYDLAVQAAELRRLLFRRRLEPPVP